MPKEHARVMLRAYLMRPQAADLILYAQITGSIMPYL